MLITLHPKPASIGIQALFAQVPGEWVEDPSGKSYVRVSSNGHSVFMLEESFYVNRACEGGFTVMDAPLCADEFEALMQKTRVEKGVVKLITHEMGAENVDFDLTVNEVLVRLARREFDMSFDREFGDIDTLIERIIHRHGREITTVAISKILSEYREQFLSGDTIRDDVALNFYKRKNNL